MGVDIPDIHQVIHIGPPCSVKFQETGHAGRDGKLSTALLHYNNQDIGKNRAGMQDDMQEYCSSENLCLRRLLLKSLDFKLDANNSVKHLHLGCNVCEEKCKCSMRLHLHKQ